MAAPSRRKTPSLKQQLFDRCYEFDFHQAVKILEFAYPNHDSIGDDLGPLGEALTLSSRIAYSYGPSDLYSLTKGGGSGEAPVRMEVNFLGLAGTVGPLPMTLTDQIVDRIKQSDMGARDFLDIFNHRLLSLLYRTRKKIWIGAGRQTPSTTIIGRCSADIVGLGIGPVRHRLSIKDRTLLKYSSLFWTNNRSRQGLSFLISDYFGIPVQVRDLMGGWKPLPTDVQTVLTPENSNRILGQTATLGRRFWDQTRFVHMRIGPLSWNQFQSFLPGGSAFSSFQDLTFLYLNRQDVRVQYVLKSADVPMCTLGQTSRLGLSSWLKTKPFLKDDDQVCLNITPEEIDNTFTR